MRPRLVAPLLLLPLAVSACGNGTASSGSGGRTSTRSLAPVAALRAAVAAQGGWVSLAQSQLKAIQSLAQGAAAGAGTAYQAKVGAMVEGLGKTLAELPDKGLTVIRERASAGDDVLTVTTSGKQLADAFVPLLEQVAPPGRLPSAADAPTTPIPFTVTIHDGALSQVSFDIKPFLPPKDRVAIGAAVVSVVLDASTAALTVQAPTGASEIDVLAAFTQLGAMRHHRA